MPRRTPGGRTHARSLSTSCLLAAGEDRLRARSCSLLAKVNAVFGGGRSDSRLTVCLHARRFLHARTLHGPVCHAAWHEFSAAECMHSCYQRAVHITGRENRAGVIFCSQEVNAFEANGPISAPAFVRLRLARPAATAQCPRSTGWQTDCRRSRR